jgi:hypothetical protein
LCSYLERTFGVGPPDPQDVAQQAFLRYASLNTEVDAITNARAYLKRSAYNIVVDEYRRLAVMRGDRASHRLFRFSREKTCCLGHGRPGGRHAVRGNRLGLASQQCWGEVGRHE